jgi:hypothetical protein
MNANDKSREIAHYLTYEYCKYKILLLNPNIKNKLSFNKEDCHLSYHVGKYSNAEYARKKHAICLAKYFCELFNINLNESKSIKNFVRNNKEDDFSDALIQIFA